MHTEARFQLISRTPRIAEWRDVLPPEILNQVRMRLRDRHWLAGQRIPVRLDITGLCCEAPVDLLAPFREIRDRIRGRFGMTATDILSVRIRDYGEGNSHGPHCDHYNIGGKLLLQTALLYLSTPESGGETTFVRATPPFWVRPEANRLVTWMNYHPDGSPDFSVEHESRAVAAGRKLVAILLFYGEAAEAAALHAAFSTIEQHA